MKKAQCQNCSRLNEGEDYEIMTQCLCGCMVDFPRKAVLSNDLIKDDQVILKTVFDRGVQSGKEPDAQHIIDEVKDDRIRVNLQ